jgi:hypothetical protein
MRREADFFEDEQELALVYMSRRLREALKIEKLFTDSGLDYLVETGTYVGGFLIKRDLTGAFFYVAEPDITSARRVLSDNGYRPYQPD